MAIDLLENNAARIWAAFTAADQTYNRVRVNNDLQPVDNAGLGRQQPWATPPGYVVAGVVEDTKFGGKYTVYKNATTNEVMVNAMGSNGWGDTAAWRTNFASYGIEQWRSSEKKDEVYRLINANVDANTKVIFCGDSKGAMAAQIMLYDFVNNRVKGVFDPTINFATKFSNLNQIANGKLAWRAYLARLGAAG